MNSQIDVGCGTPQSREAHRKHQYARARNRRHRPAGADATIYPGDGNWAGDTLVQHGGNTNGCTIQKVSASRSGSTLSEMRVIQRNRGTRPVRISEDNGLSGPGQRWSNLLTNVHIAPRQAATTLAV